MQEGEQLVGSGPVAAGDTVRWIIGDTESSVGATKKVHILVKPTRPELVTNLVINTDRRTYDSPTGKYLLIPQGAKLIGQYDSSVAFGQSLSSLTKTAML